MINQTLNHQLTPNLVNTIQKLSSSLKVIQPADNQNTRLITYALVGTVVAGLIVYHYIRQQENLD
jgi:hypothetical protein